MWEVVTVIFLFIFSHLNSPLSTFWLLVSIHFRWQKCHWTNMEPQLVTKAQMLPSHSSSPSSTSPWTSVVLCPFSRYHSSGCSQLWLFPMPRVDSDLFCDIVSYKDLLGNWLFSLVRPVLNHYYFWPPTWAEMVTYCLYSVTTIEEWENSTMFWEDCSEILNPLKPHRRTCDP